MEFYPICDETLALSPNLWYSVSGTGESPFMRVGHTITQYKGSETDVNKRGCLVLVGGATPSECFKDVYVLDLHTLAWSKFEDGKALETGRYEHACFQDKEDNVFVFGGADMERNYNDVVRIDVENKGWLFGFYFTLFKKDNKAKG